MVTLTKDDKTKLVSDNSILIEKLLAMGWTKLAVEKDTTIGKDIKNGKSSKSGS